MLDAILSGRNFSIPHMKVSQRALLPETPSAFLARNVKGSDSSIGAQTEVVTLRRTAGCGNRARVEPFVDPISRS
jgi:hypothetical protein